jgi:hypothetical protein
MRPLYVVLLHYPIVNKQGETVVTAVTNMDVHDISRTCRTYEAKNFFIVTPIKDQHELIGRILSHWKTDKSKKHHPDRVEAIEKVVLMRDFQEVKDVIFKETGEWPQVYLPDARPIEGALSYKNLRNELILNKNTQPMVLVFGTGWGISPEFYHEVAFFLEPIYGAKGRDGYNHLSVRSAAAIIMDRLFGIE